jgi:acyl-coenzyme A synthetase/AMP-(fatty) acid ligase
VEKQSPKGILDFLNSQVAPHKQIHHVEVLTVLPRNHAGKVMRHELALKEKQRAGLCSE